MLESPLIDELVMEKYGEVLTEKIRETATIPITAADLKEAT